MDTVSDTDRIAVSDTDRIAAAEAYIDALVNHNGDSVPFAPDCPASSKASRPGSREITCAAASIADRKYRVIAATVDRDYNIVGDQVRATFTVVT